MYDSKIFKILGMKKILIEFENAREINVFPLFLSSVLASISICNIMKNEIRFLKLASLVSLGYSRVDRRRDMDETVQAFLLSPF